MCKNEFDEIFVIFLTHTLFNPNTMMIKSTYTNITDSTVFTPCWFINIAGFTSILFNVEDIIIVFFIFLYILLTIRCIDYSSPEMTGLIEAIETI